MADNLYERTLFARQPPPKRGRPPNPAKTVGKPGYDWLRILQMIPEGEKRKPPSVPPAWLTQKRKIPRLPYTWLSEGSYARRRQGGRGNWPPQTRRPNIFGETQVIPPFGGLG